MCAWVGNQWNRGVVTARSRGVVTAVVTNEDQNRINGQLKASHTFQQTLGVHNRKSNTRAQRALEKHKSFDLVTQDKARTSTCSRNQHTKITS
jgi:hypothetical protein